VLSLRELRDVIVGVPKSDELATEGQLNRMITLVASPSHQANVSVSCGAGAYFGSGQQVGLRTLLLSLLFSAFAYAARRSEGSERTRATKGKSRGNFLNEFILAYTAPGERFSFLAIKPTLILEATSSRSWTSSAGVHGRPAGRGPTIEKIPVKKAYPIATGTLSQDHQRMFFGILLASYAATGAAGVCGISIDMV
jgi:hypothetical protein